TSTSTTATSDTTISTTDSTTSSSTTDTSTTPTPTPTPTPPPTQPPTLSSSFTTDENGEPSQVVVTVTASDSTSSPSPSKTGDAPPKDPNDNKGISMPTIIGLSVAGGVAVICIIAFIVWKFTRKRFSDDFDDSEAIKWPELNTHGDGGHALPTTRAGGAGFETSSEVNLTRADSRAASETNLYVAGQDPYAVPPFPHVNPNQPYRDDPGNEFYDPYSGPVPQTFHDGAEAIPMTQIGRTRSPGPQMGLDPARTRSPGPQMAYDMGRASPAPVGMAPAPMDPRARSPGPGVAYGRAASPGPQAAYGYGGYG
ncbi:hypothetical protein BXZ70DRAFT_863250, partial [Cristinia sonorae]